MGDAVRRQGEEVSRGTGGHERGRGRPGRRGMKSKGWMERWVRDENGAARPERAEPARPWARAPTPHPSTLSSSRGRPSQGERPRLHRCHLAVRSPQPQVDGLGPASAPRRPRPRGPLSPPTWHAGPPARKRLCPVRPSEPSPPQAETQRRSHLGPADREAVLTLGKEACVANTRSRNVFFSSEASINTVCAEDNPGHPGHHPRGARGAARAWQAPRSWTPG